MPTGEKIRMIRLEKGITQKQLAKLLNTSQQNLAQYESGKRKPKIETLHKIAYALNVPVTELVESDVLQLSNDIIELFSGSTTFKYLADCTQIDNLYCQLNGKGQKKAIEQVELLTKIPEYTQKENTEN